MPCGTGGSGAGSTSSGTGGSGAGGTMAGQQRVFVNSGIASYPQLTRSNYGYWALVMQVMLEARGLWKVVHTETTDREQDRRAMEALLRSVPPEMVSTIAPKTACEAWKILEAMYVGGERVRRAKVQAVRKEFAALSFRAGEDVESFTMRLTGYVTRCGLREGRDIVELTKHSYRNRIPSKYTVTGSQQ